MSENYDLIIRNAAIYTMDQDRRVITRGSLAVRGDRIAMIGRKDPAAERIIYSFRSASGKP